MNLVEAARKGAEMVDGLYQGGDYVTDTGGEILACAIGAAHIGVTSEYEPMAAAYWALSLEHKGVEGVTDALNDVYEYNDRAATSLDDAINYLEHNHPEVANLAVS